MKVKRRVRRVSNRRVCWPAPKDVLNPWGRRNIHQKGEGCKKNVVKKHTKHEQYKDALFEKQTFRHGMDVLRSERHRIYGQHLNKVSLSPFDSKRWIAKNGVDTLAYGHRDAGCRGWIEELFNA